MSSKSIIVRQSTQSKNIDLSEEKYEVIRHSKCNDYLDLYEVSLKTDPRAICPNCKCIASSKKGRRKIVHWDIVEGKPAKISLDVQDWYCARYGCEFKFSDPRSPYSGTRKTTKSFDDYVVNEFLGSENLTQANIAERLKLSAATINRILNNYYCNWAKQLPPAIPCKELWFLPCRYLGKRHLLVLGKPDTRIKTAHASFLGNSAVFLGISDEFSFESALACSNITYPQEVKEFICSLRILKEGQNCSQVNKTAKFSRLSYWSMYSPGILQDKLQEILENFERKRFSFEHVKYMLLNNYAYHDPIISRAAGSTNAYAAAKGKGTQAFPFYDLCCNPVYYLDIDTLYKIYT